MAGLIPVMQVDVGATQQVILAFSEITRGAMAVAINRSGEVAMAQQRVNYQDEFHARNRNFVPPVTIPNGFRATADNCTANIGLTYADGDPKSLGSRAATIMGPFGQQQEVMAANAVFPFFSPTQELRPTPDAAVPAGKYITKLIDPQTLGVRGKLSFKKTKHGIDVTKKSVGDFFVKGQPGDKKYGVYERLPGHQLRKLYNFLEQKHYNKLLDYQADIERVFAEQFPQQAADALDAAAQGKLPGYKR